MTLHKIDNLTFCDPLDRRDPSVRMTQDRGYFLQDDKVVFFWYAGCAEINRLQIIVAIVVCRELIHIAQGRLLSVSYLSNHPYAEVLILD